MEITGNNGHFKCVKNVGFWGCSASWYTQGRNYKVYNFVPYYTDIFNNIKRKQ